MSIALVPQPLGLADTVEVDSLRHRLALGLSWVDALTRQAAFGPLSSVLESVGPYVLGLTMDQHRADRHALRYAGWVKKRFDKALADFGSADWVVQVFGRPRLDMPYATDLDPRLYVPRRVQLTPVLSGVTPAATPLNIRTPWLWPGSAYPLPGNATTIRGRLLRGPDLAHASPIAWGRVVLTIPATETNFAAATPVGYGHGDERGEFVAILDNRAISGAALVNPIPVRLWPFLPPLATVYNPADPLASLPLEIGGTDGVNAILQGQAVPAGYVAAPSVTLSVPLGETKSDAETTLLFA